MLSIFSIHYFLFYGALTSFHGYASVYALYYTNATPIQYGYLNMVLPFLTVIVAPMVCSMVDRRRAHRSCFAISLMILTFSLISFTALPLITNQPANLDSQQDTNKSSPTATKSLLLGPWIFYCIVLMAHDLSAGVNTCLSDAFAVLQAEERQTTFGRIMVWGTVGYAANAAVLIFLNQVHTLPPLVPGLIFGSIIFTIDNVVTSTWPHPRDFKLDVLPVAAAQALTGSSSGSQRSPSDYLPRNESTLVRVLPTQQTASSDVTTNNTTTIKEAPTLKQAPVVLSAEARKMVKRSLKNGQTRSAASLVSNSLSNKTVKITSIRTQVILFYLILMQRKSLIKYLILFVFSGFFMSLQWNYFFLYLEELYKKDFGVISAVSMVGQSVLGELPFFILSRKVTRCMGRSQTLSLSFISFGLRFVIYRYLLPSTNMYCVLLADCLQGPCYGLFYVVMTEVGLDYSCCNDELISKLAARGEVDPNDKLQIESVRLSLRSTVQSVAFACYEGLGVGLGSLIGGWLVTSYGFELLWPSMAGAAVVVGLLNALISLVFREEPLRPSRRQSYTSDDSEILERLVLAQKQSSAIILPTLPIEATEPQSQSTTKPDELPVSSSLGAQPPAQTGAPRM